MDKTLQDTLQRLEADRVTALEAFCAEQAKRIQELEEENARLKREAEDFERTAEMWHGIAFEMAADQDVQIGITQGEELVIVAECATECAEREEEPAHKVLRPGKWDRSATAGNFFLDDRLGLQQTADVGCLDAPDFLPAGSHIGVMSSAVGPFLFVQHTLSTRGGLA